MQGPVTDPAPLAEMDMLVLDFTDPKTGPKFCKSLFYKDLLATVRRYGNLPIQIPSCKPLIIYPLSPRRRGKREDEARPFVIPSKRYNSGPTPCYIFTTTRSLIRGHLLARVESAEAGTATIAPDRA